MLIADFRTYYPQFDSIDDVIIQRYLDLFECQFTGDYDCMHDELQGLFVAHRVTIWSLGNKGFHAGAMVETSKSVGDESIGGEIAGASNTYGDYSATSYGIQFWSTIRLYGAGPVMAQCNA